MNVEINVCKTIFLITKSKQALIDIINNNVDVSITEHRETATWIIWHLNTDSQRCQFSRTSLQADRHQIIPFMAN